LNNNTLRDVITEKISTIGENINLRRLSKLEGGNIYSYVHNSIENDLGKIGVLVSLEGAQNEEIGKQIAMHIAATTPLAVSEDEVESSLIDRETKIIKEQLAEEGKTPEIAEKILAGKLKKFFEENTLLNQKFVMDPDLKVSEVLEKNQQKIIDFRRFKVGEGIEKEATDFASEIKGIVS